MQRNPLHIGMKHRSALAALMHRFIPRAFALMLIAALAALAVTASAGAATFPNTGAITIPASRAAGLAGPYPSTINVSGLSGSITDVNVTLTGFNHTAPEDVNVLLVGPGGQTVILMGDAGEDPDAVNLTFTLDDEAAAPLPETGVLASGSFRPSNYPEEANGCFLQLGSTGDPFPAPAPAGPYGSTLAAFDGTTANGTWSLYVFDDCGADTGSLSGGWSLDITAAPLDAAGQLAAVATELRALVDAEPGSSLADKAEDALAKVRAALAKLERTPADRQGAVGELEGAVGDLEAAVKDGGFAQGPDLMDRLTGAARLVAEEAIADAKARGGAATMIAEAEQAVARGDAKRASARFKDAVARYKDAVSKAAGA